MRVRILLPGWWFSLFLVCNMKISAFQNPKPSFFRILQWHMFAINLSKKLVLIQQKFSSNEHKESKLSMNWLYWYKFRHIEHCKTIIYKNFFKLSFVHVRHLLIIPQNWQKCQILLPRTALVRHLLLESSFHTCTHGRSLLIEISWNFNTSIFVRRSVNSFLNTMLENMVMSILIEYWIKSLQFFLQVII